MLKPLELPKFLNKSNLKGRGGELEGKNSLQRQSWQKYLTQTVFFFVKWHVTKKIQLVFSKNFLLVLTKV